MIENPTNGRAKIINLYNSLIIEIPSKKNWLVIIFMILWMGGWAMGETFAIKTIFSSNVTQSVNFFILFWLIGWTIGGVFALLIILWQLIGKEIVRIEEGILTVERSIMGIGRKKKYKIEFIKNMDIVPMSGFRIEEENNRRNILGAQRGQIKFDYGMKTVKFASNIEEAEAKMIIEKLRQNYNFHNENFVII